MALLIETGLLLVLVPWSQFWDRNVFFDASSTLGSWLTSNYTRGAVTGLGLINVWAALGELSEAFSPRTPDDHADLPR